MGGKSTQLIYPKNPNNSCTTGFHLIDLKDDKKYCAMSFLIASDAVGVQTAKKKLID